MLSVDQFLNVLSKRYCTFKRRDPFQVLLLTVLSQRTRDENTEVAGKRLFARFSTPREIANASLSELEELIKPVGFYTVKARRIKEIAKVVARQGVPRTLNGLLKLPGVGRKTANCVLVYGYGKPAIPVDVHVHRIANRLGFVNTKTVEETERELMKLVPKDKWSLVNSLMVRFGQEICGSRPKCWKCPIVKECPYPRKNLREGI